MAHSRWIREIVPLGKKRFRVVCESDDSFILYQGELQMYGIRENAECSAQTYERLCSEVFRKRAYNRCMYLLEKQDYTERQIRQKLEEGLIPAAVIEETVQHLKEIRAIDDRRYAQTYLRTNRTRYSARLLEQKLLQRGINRDLVRQLMEEDTEMMPDEPQQIRVLLEKKHYDPVSAEPEERERMRLALQRKGFSVQLIRKMT